MEFNHPVKLEGDLRVYLCDLEPQIDQFLQAYFEQYNVQNEQTEQFINNFLLEIRNRAASTICDKMTSEVIYPIYPSFSTLKLSRFFRLWRRQFI